MRWVHVGVPVMVVVALHAAALAWLLHQDVRPARMPPGMTMEVLLIASPARVYAQAAPLPESRRPPPASLPAQPMAGAPSPTQAPTSDRQAAAAAAGPAAMPSPAGSAEQLPAASALANPEPATEVAVTPAARDLAFERGEKPPYPRLSQRLGESGTVILRIFVRADGSVGEVQVQQSSGYPRLDSTARDWVGKHWRFRPARRGSEPIATWCTQPFTFNLQSEN